MDSAGLTTRVLHRRAGQCRQEDGHPVRDSTTWTILQQDGPNHLELRYNALFEHQMALITSDCAIFRLLACTLAPMIAPMATPAQLIRFTFDIFVRGRFFFSLFLLSPPNGASACHTRLPSQ